MELSILISKTVGRLQQSNMAAHPKYQRKELDVSPCKLTAGRKTDILIIMIIITLVSWCAQRLDCDCGTDQYLYIRGRLFEINDVVINVSLNFQI